MATKKNEVYFIAKNTLDLQSFSCTLPFEACMANICSRLTRETNKQTKTCISWHVTANEYTFGSPGK